MVISLLPFLWGGNRALADPQSLSSFVPVQTEDAYETNLGKLELQGVGRFTRDSHNRRGSDLWNLEPTVKLGALPGLQLDISAPYAAGSQSGANQGGYGVDVLYRFNAQTAYLPALALHAYYQEPYGAGHKSAQYTLRGIATKWLGPSERSPRLHLNLNWYHRVQPSNTQRDDQLEMSLALSTLISDRTALVTDMVHGAKPDRNANQTILEVGFRHEINDSLALSGGIGVGVGEQSPAFRAIFAIQKSFKLF
ncbi:MAG: hypothetical protein BGO51_10110 [Rhodospirillales bacterium 69-11]|jgi:hypothetical protein|nr:hypothetical protein [Rhodospirillales bacterium]MBN8925267.1 hypothetical protein [Rhodospirillales bacterium]OJW21901.1 MAG: hypothetical protein BGO51_10110 [Rhodospirillales bacterium 69-11]